MKHALSLLALSTVALFSSPSRAAEGEKEAEEPRVEVKLDTVFGLTGEKRDGSNVDALVRSFILEGRLEVSHGIDLKLYVPYTHASIRTDGDSTTRSGLGNLGVGFDREFALPGKSDLTIGAVVTVPTASGDPFSLDREKTEKAGLGEFSNRIRNFEEDEFFTVRRVGIVPRVDFATLSEGWAYSAYLKVPFLLRAGGEDLPSFSSAKIHPVGIEGIIAAQALRQFGDFETTKGFAAAIGPRFFLVEVLREVFDNPDPTRHDDARTQFGFEFVGKLRFGHVLANLGFLLPITGRTNEMYPHQHAFRVAVGAAF
ncbi:MAG: hypothetical protein ACXWUG_14320 [Polyangiales bacterium]